jgi:hypothetical protein
MNFTVSNYQYDKSDPTNKNFSFPDLIGQDYSELGQSIIYMQIGP